MRLPEDTYYSHVSLQDISDCRKRFYLRHLSRLPWPGIEMEPAMQREHSARENARFHQLAHQVLLGLPVERLSAMVHDADLGRWWSSFLAFLPAIYAQGPAADLSVYPVIGLGAPLGDRRLVARLDLVVAGPGASLVAYLWKTSRLRPSRQELSRLLQTRVALYLLVKAGWYLNRSQPVAPSQVELVYWFAEMEDQAGVSLERFKYNEADFQADEGFLTGLVETIRRLEPGEFYRTANERRCLYCSYRSLCERGVLAGNPSEPGMESLAGFELEFASSLILDD